MYQGKVSTMTLEQKPQHAPRISAQPIRRSYEYFEEVKDEFLKISWTDGQEVLTYAKVVVGSTFVLGLSIYVADLFFHRVLSGLDMIFKWVVG
jgi:preprotein translocase subunit SecE